MVLQGFSFMAVIFGMGVLVYHFYKNWEVYSHPVPPYGIYERPSSDHGVRRRKSAKSETCSICMEMVENSADLGVCLPCDHQFHKNCVEPWLRNNRSCPNCRAPIATV